MCFLVSKVTCLKSTECVLAYFLAEAFYPRDATLARVLAMALCLSVSVTSRCSIEMSERIGLFWHGSFLRPILHYVIRKFIYLQKTRVLPSGMLLYTLDLRKFRHRISIVEVCYQLSSRKVDAHSVINWTVVAKLIIPSSSDAQPL